MTTIKKRTPIRQKLKETTAHLEEETKKVQEYIDHLQRLQAEFENYRKRIEQEKQVVIKQANQELIQTLLTTVDSFQFALKNKENKEEFVKGTEMIYSEFFSLLTKQGLRPIEAVGKRFDPKFHEVMLQEESDQEEGTVLEELQKGYMLNDRVIRFSKVKISKGVKEEKNEQ